MQNNLKEPARAYYDQGNNIVLVNGNKESLTKWVKWEKERQTIEEFESLPWLQAEGFCVLCGRKMKNGMYFGVIDVDVKKTTQEAIDRGAELEKQLRITHTEETVSHGKHYIYYSRTPIKKVKDAKQIHDFCGCEILGEKKLCVMAPSVNGKYKRVNDNPATGIESLNTLFETVLKKIGYKTMRTLRNHARSERKTEVRPCILRLLEHEHLTHLEKVAVVTEHKFSGMSQEEIEILFREHKAWEGLEYDPEKTRYQINHITEGGYRRFGQDTLEGMGLCLDGCEKKGQCHRRIDNLDNPNYASFCDDPEKEKGFKPARVAQWLVENEHFKTDVETDILYYGDKIKGVWIQDGEEKLHEIVTKLLGDDDRQQHFRNILHTLKGLTYQELTFSNKIACENGLLDVETGEFGEFSLNEMAFYSITTPYDKEAKSEHWLEFLKQVLNSKDIPTLQEWSGYLLLPDYRFHKIMWLHGAGRNGKGVWARTMEGILGQDSVSSVGLEEFDGAHRFALRQLYGKLFNSCAEPTTKHILQTSLLKKSTGQDTINAECKGKDKRIDFRNCAKITIIANKFPWVKDRTTAFKERRLFITFPNEFIGQNCITNLERVWLDDPKEKMGILNWMIEGLQRLLIQGYFTESKSQEETELAFERASDTVSAFLTEIAIFDKNLVTTRRKAFEAYKNYCDVLGLEAENDKKFTQALKNTPKISITTVSKPTRERAWQGLGLRQISDDGTVTPVTDVTHYEASTIPDSFERFENKNKKIKGRGKVSKCVTRVTPNENYMENVDPDEATTCPLCLKGLPRDGFDTTVWEGKTVHTLCYQKMVDGRITHED